MKTPSVAAKHSEPDHIASAVGVKTPKHVPVVMDQEDTPEPQQKTPPKQKSNRILNYFAKTVAEGVSSVMKAAMTPINHHSVQSDVDMNTSSQRHDSNEAAESNSFSSTPEDTSPPSVEETAVDEEFETSFQDSAQRVEKKVEYSLSESQIHMPWSGLWKEMKSEGWRYKVGNNIVDYYYLHPNCAGMKKAEWLKLQKGLDYFESEDEVAVFAKEHLGWKGEKLLSTPGESMMSTPVTYTATNKRRERNTTHEEASPSKKSRTHRQHTDVETPKKSPGRSSKAPSSVSSKQGSTSSKADESKKSHIPLCDQYHTYKDKLEYCKLTLHPSYASKNERLSTTSNSVVEQLEREIKRFMMRAMGTGYEIDGMSAQSPGFMYICGGPGTGKTSAVAACSQQLTKWAKDRGFIKPCYCHINMASVASMNANGIKKQMLKDMAKRLEIEKNSTLDTFVEQFKKKGMILVVDEIDMLFKNHGASTEEWFTTLIEWCEDKELPFSMIGISNSVNDINATKIRELSNTPHELVFPTYNEADLLAILEKRIGKKVVDPKALQLIAKRVAASTGDARKALEITFNAVDKALDTFAPKWDEEVQDDSYPLVKLPQMMRAIREGMPTRHEEIIRGLPQAAKVILCIAVSLGKVWGPTAAVSIATLKKYAVQATQHAMLDDASLGQITNLVEMLMDSGLLTTDHDGCFNFNANDPNSRLHIGVQLDDVEIALEKSLLEESSFYRSLVDYIKRECPRPE
jgi:cell division control protein 6